MARAEAGPRLRVPGWLPVTTMLLAAAGLAVSGYLTVEHYTASSTLACPETGVINCQRVTTSAQSAVFGIPVAPPGVVFFAVMLAAATPAAWRTAHPLLRWGRPALALAGVGMVLYLVYAELFILDAICLWCTAVHVLALALFAVIGFGTATVDTAA